MGKLTYSLADFQHAAITFRGELLHLPIIGLRDALQYMTERPGVRYEELVGSSSTDAQFAPYKAGRRTDANLDLALRALKTYFGSVNADFEPNAEIQTIIGHRASQALGDAQATTPQAMEVLANVAKALSGHLYDALWSAKRNPTGTTSAELFDGFDTITAAEIAAGNIAAEKKNYLKLTEKITKANAVDLLKSAMFAMSPILRKEECYMFVPVDVLDAYNEAYKLQTGLVPYNDKYEQTFLEGSHNRITIVEMPNKAGSKFIHITPKRNMLVGYDGMGDEENINVKEFAPDILTYCAKMFFGVQFESIDARRLMVVELADEPTENGPTEDEPTQGNEQDGK